MIVCVCGVGGGVGWRGGYVGHEPPPVSEGEMGCGSGYSLMFWADREERNTQSMGKYDYIIDTILLVI